ncbi:hypothetical protein BJX63DRAFT_3944 [Aspergillus granulosus]|uniref:Uncharacterized protein n=1 Tax=Aspergillus granulosus TaxID=176169 RepID=A0ABR4I5R0_9EURO
MHLTDLTLSSLIALVVASYIQQLLQIAKNDRCGNGAISDWYITLMAVSASSHLAARIENRFSYWAYRYVRTGDLKGFDAFSALVVFLQLLVHWVGATTLLGFMSPSAPANYRSIVEVPRMANL